MFKQSLVLGGLPLLLFFSLPSCSSSDKKDCEGTETCACYANGTCNAGLDCRSGVCVNLSGAGGSASSTFDTKACFACAESACASAASDCKATSGCETLTKCLLGCIGNAACLTDCAKGVTPDGVAKSGLYQACALTSCTSDCTYTPTGVGGFGGFGNGSAGATASAGSSSHAGSSSAGNSSAGGAGGPPSEPTPGVNWLSLSDDAAPSTAGVNGKLGIEGVFYAYADACSTAAMIWDPVSRCIRGTMCAANSTGSNWGVAIGFDFNNVGSVKHAWNATTAGVTGIAWKTSPLLTAMQVWVQNMDPSFNGSCSSMNCSINAPPDGASSASMNGQFSFANMVKDTWGPDADSYVFNPANISSLQFKLPAKATETQYDLCIVGVGLAR